jgi:LmbE family N-acetylglucosaminyl deacetylase
MAGTPDNDHPNALSKQPVYDVAEKITYYIREIRPDIVLTHDPVGGYHHPDHIAVHKATLEAFEASGDPDRYANGLEPFQAKKLYYHVFPRKFIRFIVWVLRLFGQDPSKFGKNGDIDLQILANDPDYPQHVRVEYNAYKDIKRRADECHSSQMDLGSQSPGLVNWVRYKLLSGKDAYMQAYPPLPKEARLVDLFDGADG